jgi:hypothetical protein
LAKIVIREAMAITISMAKEYKKLSCHFIRKKTLCLDLIEHLLWKILCDFSIVEMTKAEKKLYLQNDISHRRNRFSWCTFTTSIS